MSLTDGAELVVISLCATILENLWDLSTFQVGFLGTALYIGYTIGSYIGGPLSDKYIVRKYLLIL